MCVCIYIHMHVFLFIVYHTRSCMQICTYTTQLLAPIFMLDGSAAILFSGKDRLKSSGQKVE